nr:hypothetical protein [Candidatus Njordarchaeum guaymaensis]
MLHVAINSHQTSDCPRETIPGKKTLKRIFSAENARRFGVRVVHAYISCPKATGEDHKAFFVVDASNADMVRKFFVPLTVDVRQVTPFSEALAK